MKIRTILAAAMVVMAAGCAKEQDGVAEGQIPAPQIIAEMADEPATRTCIDADSIVPGENVPVLWMPGDQIGVFTTGSSNVHYTNDEQTVNVPNASFSSNATVSGEVQYAYYPYDAANDGNSATELTGTIPAEQTMGQAIPADYKYGKLKAVTAEGGYKFEFHNMFSLVRFKIDATGTALEGKTLESVTMTVTRDGAAVPVTGDFTFRADDGTFKEISTSNELKTVWNQTLDGELSSFATVFPKVRKGDNITFTFKTANYEASLTATSKADFASEKYYTFPLTLANFSGLNVMETVSGTFKAATYNIKSSTNGGIGTDITADGWDFFGFSECFSGYSKNLSSYSFGSKSKTLGDGLYFGARNATCSLSNEYTDTYDQKYGGLNQGADQFVKKGFRYYLITMTDGTQVDVIITHMNTYETDKHLAAQHSQLTEVATWIKNNCGTRPVIFMGDTNCRYTRHDFETYFWSVIRQKGLTYNDPWVDYQWAGVYPTYPSKSLMASDATGTNSETDIICSTTQNGEVVDKVIYINYADAATQIKANDYLRDMDYSYSDHKPIVVNFSYTSKVAVK